MRCEECGAEADEQGLGWRALIGEEDDGELMVGVFCPDDENFVIAPGHPLLDRERVLEENGRFLIVTKEGVPS
jgi:hypothetical protein